jgi:hypothetical protein
MTHIKQFKNLDFVAIAEPGEYGVDYKVYDVVTWTDEDALYRKDDEFIGDIGDADLYLSGCVKWDGCSNWYFDEQDRVMLHGCSREDLTRLGEVMAQCWDWTAELCPNWMPSYR